MVVYVDLVFMTNLAVDGIVLLLTSKACRLQPTKLRLFGAASLGAMYAASMFLITVPFLYSFAGKVLVPFVMVLCAFGYGSMKRFLKAIGMFFSVSFLTLGGVVGISFLARTSGTAWGDMSYSSSGDIAVQWQMQAGLIAVAFALSVWLFHGTGEARRKRQQVEAYLWDVTVSIEDQAWTVRGLLDTGNRLYEPLTRTPVMIMEASVWKDHLPSGWCERLRGESADQLITELDAESTKQFKWSSRLRLVPYRAVNGSPKLMLAVKPDNVVLSSEGQKTHQATRVLIGLDGGTLASDESYRAIIHPELAQAGVQTSAPSQPA